MKFRAITACVLSAVALSGAASAQSITWSQRIYGAEVSPSSYQSYGPSTSLAYTRSLMQWSAAGTPGIVVAGAHGVDGLVVKISPADGSELWRSNLEDAYLRQINDVQVDAAGDVITAGQMMPTNIPFDMWSVEKTSGSTGARIWYRHLAPPSGNGGIEAIAIDHANDIVAFGSRREETNPTSHIVKFSGATGDVVWLTTIPHYYTWFTSVRIATDALGNVFASLPGAALIKVLSDGTVDWTVSLPIGPDSTACAIRALTIDPVTSDVIVAGSANCSTARKAFVARIRSSDGDIVWAAPDIGGADTSDAVALAFAGSDDVIVAGGHAAGAGPQHWFAARLSVADGSVAWTVPVDTTSYTATDVAIGPDGEVLLSGVCEPNAFCAARLDGATGARDWLTQTGAPYLPATRNYPNTILAVGGGVFFGGRDTSAGATTWTVHRVDNAISDALFDGRFE